MVQIKTTFKVEIEEEKIVTFFNLKYLVFILCGENPRGISNEQF